ncbi:hypothetical protein JCM5296_005568, partial [Sporobolomyces johnsonii]
MPPPYATRRTTATTTTTPLHPPPYCASPPRSPSRPSPSPSTPSSPDLDLDLERELEQDPHYLATATQRSHFVHLSDLFESEAVANHHYDDEDGGEAVEKGTGGDKEEGKMTKKAVRMSIL